jgi:Bacterial PH domain
MPEPLTLPRRYRPFGARIAAAVAAVVLVGFTAFIWLALPRSARATFGLAERLTVVVIYAAVLAVLNGMFRTSAHADDEGLTVTNGYVRRRFAWPQIVRISLGVGRPWALLDLADGTTVSVMAIQGSDGARADRATRDLKRVLAERSRPS